MHIDSSQIGMESARTYSSFTARRSGYRLGNTRQDGLFDARWGAEDTEENMGGVFSGTGGSLSDLYDSFQNKMSAVRITSAGGDRGTATMINTIKHECVNFIFMLLFGDKRRQLNSFQSMADVLTGAAGGISDSSGQAYLTGTKQYIHMENENTAFSTRGTVRTADGREISFGLEMSMSRSFAEYYQENYTVAPVQVCDPLVINLDGDIAGLSDQKFTFDLDQDGILDTISRLKQGSGYLALDRNGDGRINDGGELFGTQSGDGFKDLKAYDDDGDGWIDEDDEIFDKLLIWTQDEEGRDVLYHLKDVGVGAICLESVSTNFALNNERNETNGYIRQTGVFLYENGEVGSVQHLDVAT